MVEHNRIKDSVFEIIKRYASEDKPVDQNEIIKHLQDDSRNECDRKTVSRALEKLREEFGRDEDGDWKVESVKLHFEVVSRSSSPIYKRYWLEINDDGEFTDEELLFLMDAVQFSKHVDQKFAEEIARKLTYLSGNKYSKVFELHKKVNEKHYPVRKDFFLTLGDINTAIEAEKMISFYVNEYGVDKKLHHVGDPVTVCPYRIVVSDGNYYLLCGLKRSSVVKSYRIDRITDVKVSDEGFPHTPAKTQAKMYPNEYIVEHRYMNGGEAVDVTITIDRSILGDVIDAFGTRIKIDPADKDANRLTIHLKSGERDIVEWAMRFGEFATIVEPDYLKYEIVERARALMNSYRNRDSMIYYLECVKYAEEDGMLGLRNIDLNGRTEYKKLAGVKSASFINNGIVDFSFLPDFTELASLTISRNRISDPEVMSQLSNLESLKLSSTGITNLDFLSGMEKLTILSINEYSVENAEAIYSLPNLRVLSVSKPIARLLDRKKLERAFGPDLRYNNGDVRGSMRRLPVRDNSDYRKRFEDRVFSTVEVTDVSVRTKLCSLIFSGAAMPYGEGKEFGLIEETCDGKERLRLYKDIAHYTGAQYAWYMTYEDKSSGKKGKFDTDKVYAISIFKQDHGLKMVALAQRKTSAAEHDESSYGEIRSKCRDAVTMHVMYLIDNKIGWAEISREPEMIFSRVCTMDDIVDPAELIKRKVFKNIEADSDGYHYYRINDDGKRVSKIVYGHIS